MTPDQLEQRLRKFSSHLAHYSRNAGSLLVREAADEIKRLQADNERQREVVFLLSQFEITDDGADGRGVWVGASLIEKALAALD